VVSDPQFPPIAKNLRIVFEHCSGIVQIAGHILHLEGQMPTFFHDVEPVEGSKVNNKKQSWGLHRVSPRAVYYREIVVTNE
jgi:hypothetical protein